MLIPVGRDPPGHRRADPGQALENLRCGEVQVDRIDRPDRIQDRCGPCDSRGIPGLLGRRRPYRSLDDAELLDPIRVAILIIRDRGPYADGAAEDQDGDLLLAIEKHGVPLAAGVGEVSL